MIKQDALLIDFYELTMAHGYFHSNKKNQTVYFDLFFRQVPDNGGYAIFAGLESIATYLQNLSFQEDDIKYLQKRDLFSEEFLSYLANFSFHGTVFAQKEGSVIFPHEPILRVEANIIEAQLIETFLLQVCNHESLIATKASRITLAANKRPILEMGARRAHGKTASIKGARAAYIGGIHGTSNTIVDKLYNIPAKGTMAHSWVQLFDSEKEAFEVYAETYPNQSTFLVDTFDTLQSGIPNAIQVIKEKLLPKKVHEYAIRIDSGDLTYLSKQARKMLDDAGLNDCKIVASNSLDEFSITSLLQQGAPIDLFGVGERLITAKSDPVFGFVYKLVALKDEDKIIPKIKLSDNIEKTTIPHVKQVYRIIDKNTNKAVADYIALYDEQIDSSKPLELFDPNAPNKRKAVLNYTATPRLHKIIDKGELVQELPSLNEIRSHRKEELSYLLEEVKRFDHPHKYYVDFSKKLWNLQREMINDFTNK